MNEDSLCKFGLHPIDFKSSLKFIYPSIKFVFFELLPNPISIGLECPCLVSEKSELLSGFCAGNFDYGLFKNICNLRRHGKFIKSFNFYCLSFFLT